MAEYLIQGETLTGIADQVRRISGVDGKLTPEQMETNLLNVTPLGEYPKAEESAFGVGLSENGIEAYTYYSTAHSGDTWAWEFTAGEAFAILGLRYYEGSLSGYSHSLKLWNSDGEAVREVVCSANDGYWSEIVYFDEPVNVAVGETYRVSVYCGSSGVSLAYARKNTVTFNSKLSNIDSSFYYSGNNYPSADGTTEVPLVDIAIGTVQAELPNDYQIARNTMDDIAEEVQRITGTTEKMTTAQITTSLSEIEVYEDYEGVNF